MPEFVHGPVVLSPDDDLAQVVASEEELHVVIPLEKFLDGAVVEVVRRPGLIPCG
jgi:hypothetical protein